MVNSSVLVVDSTEMNPDNCTFNYKDTIFLRLFSEGKISFWAVFSQKNWCAFHTTHNYVYYVFIFFVVVYTYNYNLIFITKSITLTILDSYDAKITKNQTPLVRFA